MEEIVVLDPILTEEEIVLGIDREINTEEKRESKTTQATLEAEKETTEREELPAERDLLATQNDDHSD